MRALAFLAAAGALLAAARAEPAPFREPQAYTAEIVAEFPHDPGAFTQGLFIADGRLFETTGQYYESALREVDLQTGKVLREKKLRPDVFGEGAVRIGDDVVVLTWREETGFVFGLEDFAEKRRFSFEGEGWGLASDGRRLVMSDGTPALRFLDPKTFEEKGRLEVTLRGKPLSRLNELEWIDGRIFANVWFTNAIVIIDPATGVVEGVVDLRNLRARMQGVAQRDVLNGVAYDAATGKIYVTGKNWPKLFEIRLAPKP